MPEKVGYARSRNINGPWKFKGIINDVPHNCVTNRPRIIDFKDHPGSFITTERCPAEAVTGDRSASTRCITTLTVQ